MAVSMNWGSFEGLLGVLLGRSQAGSRVGRIKYRVAVSISWGGALKWGGGVVYKGLGLI